MVIAWIAVAAGFGLAQQHPPVVQEGFLDAPGASIFYQDTGGNGVPVVFLHSNTSTVKAWDHQIPFLTGAGFRFIAYDRRGYGRTKSNPQGPASTGPDDLLALIDHLKIEKFHLVGVAGGGFIAVDFAISYPTRLRSLILACSQGGVQDPDFLDAIKRLDGFRKLAPAFRELAPSYHVTNPAGVARWSEIERTSRAPEPEQGPPQPRKNHVTLASLEQFKFPALILAGDADSYAPPVLMRRIASRIKNAEFAAFPEVGHSLWWEKPDEFNRALLTFVRRH